MKDKFSDLMPMGRRGLVQITNLILIVLVAILALFRLVLLGAGYFPFPALAVVLGGLVNAVYIGRGGSLDTAARALIGLLLFGLAYGGFNTGAFSGPVILLSPLIPLCTMLLMDVRSAGISLLLTSVVLGALFLLDSNGLVPPNQNDPGLIQLGRLIALLAVCLASTLIVWCFVRISRSLLETIRQQSNTDYLTGVFNRRGIEVNLRREVGRARRTNSWLSLIIADVDFFKLYNDNNGHQAGDRCLVAVAQLIQSCSARITDVVGRFGGEEFVVILPDTDGTEAPAIAENMRRKILEQKIPYAEGDSRLLSLTFGVVSVRGRAIDSSHQLISQADVALYKGKQQGRNCVVSIFSDPAETDVQCEDGNHFRS
ncbi:MAG: diguanylate cyclase [Pseudomonadales bacterium]|nr:diguanylate cyclase [Pseudomonadales bacterium]